MILLPFDWHMSCASNRRSYLACCLRSKHARSTLLYTAIAEGYYHEKRYKEALSYALKAVQVNPASQTAYAGLGHIYFGMKKLKEAKMNFEKALAIEPKSVSSRFNLAMTCLAIWQ